eukprot:6198904-Pleurochrysis_carterae.AAC.1
MQSAAPPISNYFTLCSARRRKDTTQAVRLREKQRQSDFGRRMRFRYRNLRSAAEDKTASARAR